MAEHQQLPWAWHPKSKDQSHNGSIYRIERPGHVYAVAMQPRYVEDDQFKADASYIVKACNAFPDLVKALEQIAAIENKEFGPDWEEIEEARKIANDVLGRVKGAPDHG
jgi:hypothetical protein